MHALRHWLSLLLLLPLLFAAQPGRAALPVAVGNDEPLPSLAPVLERSTPAVVNILTRATVKAPHNPLMDDPFFRDFFNLQPQRKRETQGLGSGVIVDARRGYILTNHHVINRADIITVTLQDGRKLDAKLIGTDPDSDVAVIKVPAEQLVALPLANSDALRVGDFVVAIGNPFGLGQTVTSGIVSALGRSGLGIEGYEDFIQTDADINPGNSGGALINLRGELIGINTAILSRSGGSVGIGFAIPINMARSIMQQLIESGKVQRGRLGAQAQDLTPELARAFDLDPHATGAVVVNVSKDSPADRAGLRVGDIVQRINGRKVERADDLRNFVGLLRVGTEVDLVVLRGGRNHSIRARIGKTRQVKLDASELHYRLQGAEFSSLGEDHPAYGRIDGILISNIKRGSLAARSGLRKGDIITHINNLPVNAPADAKKIITDGGGRIRINAVRKNSRILIVLN